MRLSPLLCSGGRKPGDEAKERVIEMKEVLSGEMVCFYFHPRQHATTTQARRSMHWWR